LNYLVYYNKYYYFKKIENTLYINKWNFNLYDPTIYNKTRWSDSISSIYNEKLSNSSNLQNFNKTGLVLSNTYTNDESVNHHFLYLRQSTIKSFFISKMVDVPLCFQKSKSLYRKTFELPLLKFTNFLMRQGKREKTLKCFSSAFIDFTNNFLNSTVSYEKYQTFNSIFITLNMCNVNPDLNLTKATFNTDFNTFPKNTFKSKEFKINRDTIFTNMLLSKLKDYFPLFSVYIRKVGKTARKHSRGKSGKYVLIWKYVPIYKRLYLTMRWLLKDIKFQKLKTLRERLTKTLELLFLTPHASLVCKLRKFIHFFIFQNFKKTLLDTLTATS